MIPERPQTGDPYNIGFQAEARMIFVAQQGFAHLGLILLSY